MLHYSSLGSRVHYVYLPMGMGQMMDREKEKKGSPGSSAQDAIWPVHMDLLIFGVDVVQYES